jgi:hypothetical protein
LDDNQAVAAIAVSGIRTIVVPTSTAAASVTAMTRYAILARAATTAKDAAISSHMVCVITATAVGMG